MGYTNSDIIPGNKSEIDMYLDEGVYKPGNEEYEDFDALNWWKANSLKFRHLSKWLETYYPFLLLQLLQNLPLVLEVEYLTNIEVL